MPDTTPSGVDAAALSTLDALRVAVLILRTEVHALREDLTRKGTLSESDRLRLALLESKIETLQTTVDHMSDSSWFDRILSILDRILGQGDEIDKAKRPLTRLFVLSLAVAVMLTVGAAPFVWFWYTSDAQQMRRDERERRAYIVDSLRHAVPRLQEQVNENRAVTDSAAALLDSLTTEPSFGAAPDAP